MSNHPSIFSTENSQKHFCFLGGILFLLVMLVETAIFLYLIKNQRVVGGHDGFEYFYLQYYFLNNVVNSGEIPQWIPFITHGIVGTWWYVIQASILQNILLLYGQIAGGLNFNFFYYAGIFFDELLLLVGVWLLGKRFFASVLTVFFVTLSVMGSCIWVLQPWWNFHFYYAIPLTLFFAHLFLDSGKWRYFFLAGNLLFIQSLGGLPYFLPVISLVVFLYFFFFTAFNFKEVKQKVRNIYFGKALLITLSLTILSFTTLYIVMNFGTDQMVNYNYRSTDGTSSLGLFLNYGGRLSLMAFLEMMTGVSPALDYTLYIGIICVPLILSGLLFNATKKNFHLYLITIILLFFSMGTWVSIVFYYCWPMMHYFRHLALVTPLVKIFLCFLAGVGFEAFYLNDTFWKRLWIKQLSSAFCSVIMFVLCILLWLLSSSFPGDFEFFVKLVEFMVPRYLPVAESLFHNENVLKTMLNLAVLTTLLASVLFMILSISRRKRLSRSVIYALLVVHFASIYGFKFSEIKFKTFSLNDELFQTTDFKAMDYPVKREPPPVIFDNPRSELLKTLPFIKPGILNFSAHAFLLNDALDSPFRTNFVLRPFDKYLRAYWGQDISDVSVNPSGHILPSQRAGGGIKFPQTNSAALKISGVTEDKIQFFSGAVFMPSDNDIAARIVDPDYKGNVLFLLSPDEPSTKNQTDSSVFSYGKGETAGKRLRLPYQVELFDANNIEIVTKVDSTDMAWLLYSDVWHPFWRATVNGHRTEVYQANLAYKAVRLEAGVNHVHFYFKSVFLSCFHTFLGINSLFWLGMIIFLATNLSLNRRPRFR